jgi:hypothetical protein
MEARLLRAALLIAAAVLSLGASRPYASVRSQHFIVSAPTKQLATEICTAAEQFRHDLAMEWLGRDLPEWQGLCPIKADVAPNLGAGGATSFVFRGGTPTEFTMNIQGSRERILDSVLPHEITHTIFATHFGRPLPRWADEGACTTVEHVSEKAKQDNFLVQFLTTDRGIPFNRMFQMTDYPPDILPLYSQGYSLARFFIQQGGKPKFVEYVGEGMRTNNWTATTRKYYGFNSLSDLQLTWVEWVRKGSPTLPNGAVPETLLVSSQASSRATPNPAAVASQMVSNTQMASLTQQPRSRVPDGALSSWQTTQSQNARVFAQADQTQTPPQPTGLARPAVIGPAPQGADYSSVSRPVSEGWYAKRRDQARETLESPGAPAQDGHGPQQEAQPPQSAAGVIPAPPSRRAAIEAQPLTPAASPGQSDQPRASRVVLEWSRQADQPFQARQELTGVAVNDRATLVR